MRARVNNTLGLSLVEMVVAVLVLSIGVIAGFQGLAQSRIGIGGEVPRLLANQVALNRAATYQLLGSAGARSRPSQVEMGGILWQLDISEKTTFGGFVEVDIRVTSQGYPGAIYVAYAPVEPPT